MLPISSVAHAIGTRAGSIQDLGPAIPEDNQGPLTPSRAVKAKVKRGFLDSRVIDQPTKRRRGPQA